MPFRLGVAFITALLSFLVSVAARAQNVELRSLDETVTLEGNLIDYDGAYYRLDTIYGPITVDAEGVTCTGPGCPDPSMFFPQARITSEVALAETLLPALFAGFAADRGFHLAQPEVASSGITYTLTRADGTIAARFTVVPGNSDSGFLALLNGDTDIALTLRQPTEAEHRADRMYAPDDPPLSRRVRILGLDALVPVVAEENPIDAISMPDLTAIMTGEIVNWQSLGGPDAPIALHVLSAETGLAQAFANKAFNVDAIDLGPDVTTHYSATALSAAVARDVYALGVTALSAHDTARTIPLVDGCGFSQAANADAVKTEDYPLTTPVYAYLAPQRLPPLVRDFLSWTETDSAEGVVAAAGFVDQSVISTPLTVQGARLANAVTAAGGEVPLTELQSLVATLGQAERLSSTFRFTDGSVEFDPHSRASVTRLASAIERGEFDGRRLILVGFSDSAGDATANRRLSLRRAEAARDAILAAAGRARLDRTDIEVHAFGEAMPIACEDSDWGRATNRRVEVWLQ